MDWLLIKYNCFDIAVLVNNIKILLARVIFEQHVSHNIMKLKIRH